VAVKLFSISISHPARAAGLMLRYKGIEHEILDIPPGSQRLVLRLNGFKQKTVPALQIDGRKVEGSLRISRALDELQPEPPLFPSDPQERAAVEEAERWGDAALQPIPRNLFRWGVSRDPELRRALADLTGMPAPRVAAEVAKPMAWYFARMVSGTTEESIRADLANLPDQLDHVDRLIDAGIIGDEQPNAADFQIGTSVRVLLNFPQLRPLVEARPAAELALRIAPDFGRELPLRLPPEWLPAPARASLTAS
jgi:glutathione S-transferase